MYSDKNHTKQIYWYYRFRMWLVALTLRLLAPTLGWPNLTGYLFYICHSYKSAVIFSSKYDANICHIISYKYVRHRLVHGVGDWRIGGVRVWAIRAWRSKSKSYIEVTQALGKSNYLPGHLTQKMTCKNDLKMTCKKFQPKNHFFQKTKKRFFSNFDNFFSWPKVQLNR